MSGGGDTPSQTLKWKAETISGNSYFIGELNNKDAKIYVAYTDESHTTTNAIICVNPGTMVTLTNVHPQLLVTLKSMLETKVGYQINAVEEEIIEYSQGGTVADWDTFEDIGKLS